MKALFALVVLLDLVVLSGTFDLDVLSGTSQALVAKPISNVRITRGYSLVAANETFSESLDFAPRNHFGL